MRPGERRRVTVESIDTDGQGVVRREGVELRIPGGTPGDVLTVRLDARSQHSEVGWCQVEEVHSRGERYRAPTCSHAWPTRGLCGGCPLAHLSPEAASELKLSRVRGALAKHHLAPVLHWHGATSERHYRNRCHFVVGRDRLGRHVLGSFSPRSHRLAPMDACEIARPPLPSLADALELDLRELHAPVYPQEAGLRYVTLRAGSTGDALLDLVIGGDPTQWRSAWIPKLAQQGLWKGISYSVNDASGNAMRIAPSHLAWGDATVVETLGSVELGLSAASFAQLNSAVAREMYGWAAAAASPARAIWDLYCGVGGLGITVADAHRDSSPYLVGVDSIGESVQLARTNAARAGLSAQYYAEADLSRQLPCGLATPDLVLLNPPRRGLDKPVMDAMASLRRGELIYMSCNPSSFARDAEQLLALGWHFEEVHAFDMLPRTGHVELIALARR